MPKTQLRIPTGRRDQKCSPESARLRDTAQTSHASQPSCAHLRRKETTRQDTVSSLYCVSPSGAASMSCQFEHLDACLPITALHVLSVGNARVVLYGSGPYVYLTEETSGVLQCRVRVLERSTVHGIRLAKTKLFENGGYSATLLAWGGPSIRVLRVKARRPYTNGYLALDTMGPEYTAPDWILNMAFLEPQRDIGGSSLPSRACLITAHNVLFGLRITEAGATHSEAIQVDEITTGLKSVLYSADVAWISPTQVLVAAGTVFGEIVVWSCTFSSNASYSEHSVRIHHAFTGHEGSIFGVQISPEIQYGRNEKQRLLASCSDDRTIQVWDISDCDTNTGGAEMSRFINERPTRSTGFGDVTLDELDISTENCIAKAWGHISRIWAVNFLDLSVEASTPDVFIRLVSRGEDATCQLWELRLPRHSCENGVVASQSGATLTHKATYNYHFGKNIWATGFFTSPNASIIYTGGADGKLASFGVDKKENAFDRDIQLRLHLFGDTHSDMADGTDPSTAVAGKPQGKEKLLRFGIVAERCFIGISSLGRVVCGYLPRERGRSKEPSVIWGPIGTFAAFESFSVVLGQPDRGVAIIGDASGGLWLYSHDTRSMDFLTNTENTMSAIINVRSTPHYGGPSPMAFVTVSMDTSNEGSLFIEQADRPKTFSRRTFKLHEGFTATCAVLIRRNSYLVLGSRTGYIALAKVDKSTDSSEIAVVLYRKLSEDSITSVTSLPQPSGEVSNEETILTTARDGYYRVHTITGLSGSDKAPGLETVHKSTPPVGPHIEGSFVDKASYDIILFGFRSKDFIVWNESTQTEIMAVDCGGAHRAWDYHISRGAKLQQMFLCTQASALNLCSKVGESHRNIRRGGHGREIKTMALSPLLYDLDRKSELDGKGDPREKSDPDEKKRHLLATGSEDTAIRLFIVDEETSVFPWGSFKCVRTLEGHETGLQQVKWSPCGQYLFSSGGREDFYVWRIRHVPAFGIGVVLEGKCPKSSPTSDLRIMGFDVTPIADGIGFLLCLAYSNSTVRIFSYCPVPTSSFALVAKGQYKSNCLTHINFVISPSKISLISSSTDGHIAVWDMSESLARMFSVADGELKQSSNFKAPSEPVTISWNSRRIVHQSSVKAMQTVQLPNGKLIIFSGGDDNALSISRFDWQNSEEDEDEPSFSKPSFCTSSHPQAHAAAITAVAVIGHQGHPNSPMNLEYLLITSGNDQRLKLWSVEVDLAKEGQDGAVVALLKDEYTAAADISCVDVFSKGDTRDGYPGIPKRMKNRILLGGVGIDMWAIRTKG